MGFSSDPPYLTVLNSSVLKHTRTDSKNLGVQGEILQIGFPETFWINANKKRNQLFPSVYQAGDPPLKICACIYAIL